MNSTDNTLTLKKMNETLFAEFLEIDKYKENPKMLQSYLNKAKVKNEIAKTIQGNIKLELEATKLAATKGMTIQELPTPFEGKRENSFKM